MGRLITCQSHIRQLVALHGDGGKSITSRDMPKCPECGSEEYIKYGRTRYGKQRYKCKTCRRQYIEGSGYRNIALTDTELVDKLLLESLSLTGIARATGIPERHLQSYVTRKLESVTREVELMPKKRVRLTLG
ncbi:IS1/IS1595 family N-terminal zinc-binding domain-containing protein [Rubidibacter lacunae]